MRDGRNQCQAQYQGSTQHPHARLSSICLLSESTMTIVPARSKRRATIVALAFGARNARHRGDSARLFRTVTLNDHDPLTVRRHVVHRVHRMLIRRVEQDALAAEDRWPAALRPVD